ncbi:MAG: DnaJ domain-containing protein [Chitinophagales bacterium]|nr:DnaJ domain-containing protein [Chitinophagales bacterium]MBP9704519.1 DnaJ domain-containing protein [Chitinophagales bacterium]
MNKNTVIVLLRTNDGKFVLKPFAMNKFLLPIFGVIMYSFSGLFIGLLIGLILDIRFISKPENKKNKQTLENEIRLQSLMLAVYIMQVCETFRFISLDEILKRLGKILGTDFIQPRRLFIQELSRQKIQVTPICLHLVQILSLEKRTKLLADISGIAVYKNISPQKLSHAMHTIGLRLELSTAAINAMISEVFVEEDGLKIYFDVLGISPLSNFRDTKKAYLTLVKKYHPDMAIHHSFTDQKILSDKFRKTKEAYVIISKAKGWK